jgi:hypothetical protein
LQTLCHCSSHVFVSSGVDPHAAQWCGANHPGERRTRCAITE